ncbi:VanZ family protein [Candidatus Fermentibacteria bacterium]|nr:VanZ family protein [Candidatus Fermentibacteria bacterium]
MRRRFWKRLLLAAVAAAVWIQSDRPSIIRKPLFPFQDKVFHVIEFAVVGLALSTNRDLFGGRHRWIVMTAAGMAWAGLDEAHQSWVPGRDCSALDFAADALGLCLVLLAARRRFERRVLADTPYKEYDYNP